LRVGVGRSERDDERSRKGQSQYPFHGHLLSCWLNPATAATPDAGRQFSRVPPEFTDESGAAMSKRQRQPQMVRRAARKRHQCRFLQARGLATMKQSIQLCANSCPHERTSCFN
jgi:hypothetical protein